MVNPYPVADQKPILKDGKATKDVINIAPPPAKEPTKNAKPKDSHFQKALEMNPGNCYVTD